MTDRSESFFWNGQRISFEPADTIAAALERAGVTDLGAGQGPCNARYFCGIGACQACVVSVGGTPAEACLTPAQAGQQVRTLKPVRQ